MAALPLDGGRLLLHPTGAGDTRELPNPDRVRFDAAGWLPDGRLIGFGQPTGGLSRGYVQAIDSGPPRPFTAEGVTQVRWWALPISPDSTRVIARLLNGTIVVHPLDGGAPQPLAGLLDGDVPVEWSDDPNVIFVARGGGLPWIVERLDLRTGQRSPALEIRAREQAGLRLSTVTLAQDGRHYVHSYSRLLTTLSLVEHLQ
jgi:hypothetical protein